MDPSEAIEVCEEIIEDLIPQLPERAEDFRNSIEEKMRDVQDWIIERNHVTDAQSSMIENTRAACWRWIEE